MRRPVFLRFAPGVAAALATAVIATLAALALLLVAPPVHGASLVVKVTGAHGQPLADAVVAVMVKGAKALAAPGTMAEIAQKNRQFQPQVSVVQAGTQVRFPNLDSVRHHVYSFSPVNKFELKLYSGVPAEPVAFDRPGIAVLGCNIHDRMHAWVQVVETPYFAKTDANGEASLDVPAGEHRLRAWHFLLGDAPPPVEEALVVAAGGARATLALPGADAAQ